jgi:hypothetical protein
MFDIIRLIISIFEKKKKKKKNRAKLIERKFQIDNIPKGKQNEI